MFVLCFALAAGMVSPVIRVNAEEQQESVASEVEVSEEVVVLETETEAIAEAATDLSYTDENGNVYTYILDEIGNATITGITVSGAALVIPEVIDDAPVVAVNNANQCVVTNPGIRIPELTINCPTVGERAFYGTTLGTLTIGEDIKAFVVCNDGETAMTIIICSLPMQRLIRWCFRRWSW